MPKIIVFDKEYFLNIPVILDPIGRPCLYTAADGEKAKALNTYYSLQGDLQEAQSMIHYLQGNTVMPDVVKYSLFKAFIVQYAKCFTQARTGRKTKVEPNVVFGEDVEFRKIHDEIMELRHGYIAHAGDGIYEYGATVIQLNPDLANPTVIAHAHAGMKFMDHTLKLLGYSKVCVHVLKHVNAKIERLLLEFENELYSTPIEELYKKAKTPLRKDFKISTGYAKTGD